MIWLNVGLSGKITKTCNSPVSVAPSKQSIAFPIRTELLFCGSKAGRVLMKASLCLAESWRPLAASEITPNIIGARSRLVVLSVERASLAIRGHSQMQLNKLSDYIGPLGTSAIYQPFPRSAAFNVHRRKGLP